MKDEKYFEEMKAILERIPDEGNIDFAKAAQTATTLIDIFGSISKAANQNIREDMYSMVLMTCIVLEAHSECAGVAKCLFNSVFDDCFNRVRPEVSRMRREQIEEKKRNEPKVGSVFEYEGKRYRCLLDEDVCTSSDDDPCNGCAFNNWEAGECTALRFNCTEDYRSDGKNVKFVLEEGCEV